MGDFEADYKIKSVNTRLWKRDVRLAGIIGLILKNPGVVKNKLRDMAQSAKPPIITSHRTFNDYIAKLEKSGLIVRHKIGNKYGYYVGDIVTGQVKQYRKYLEDCLDVCEKQLQDPQYHSWLDPEWKVILAVDLVHHILRPINQIQFLKPNLENDEVERFEKLERRFQSLLVQAANIVRKDKDADNVYPCVLAILDGEDIRDMKPMLRKG